MVTFVFILLAIWMAGAILYEVAESKHKARVKKAAKKY